MDAVTRDRRASVLRTQRLTATDRVVWRHVIIFALLAYAFAWAMWGSMWPTIRDAISSGRTASSFEAGGLAAIGMFAPALAAIVMRLVVSKEGFKRSLGPVRKWRYYLIAVGLAAAFVSSLIGIAALGIGDVSLDAPISIGLGVLLIGVPVGAALAFGEEYGWRGYLLPKLLPLGEVKASIVVALIWAPWHLPVLLAGLNYPGENIPVVIATFMLSTMVLSLLHTRFFVATGGSVLVVSFLHGALNALSDRFAESSHLNGSPLLISGGGLIATAIMAVVVIGAYAFRRRYASSSEERPEPASVGIAA